MKHQVKGKKLGRKRDQRRALGKSMLNSLIKYGKIETTEAKAKALRPKIEKLVTRAKIDSLHSRRILNKSLAVTAAEKMMKEIGPKYKERKGGYTRIIKLDPRKKDAAPKAIIEFI